MFAQLLCFLDKLTTEIVSGFIPADVAVLSSSEPEKVGNVHNAIRPNIIPSYRIILEKIETRSEMGFDRWTTDLTGACRGGHLSPLA